MQFLCTNLQLMCRCIDFPKSMEKLMVRTATTTKMATTTMKKGLLPHLYNRHYDAWWSVAWTCQSQVHTKVRNLPMHMTCPTLARKVSALPNYNLASMLATQPTHWRTLCSFPCCYSSSATLLLLLLFPHCSNSTTTLPTNHHNFFFHQQQMLFFFFFHKQNNKNFFFCHQ